MPSEKNNNWRCLLVDVTAALFMTYISALLLDWFKPGIISNFFDSNILLLLLGVCLVAVLIFPPSHYKLFFVQRIYYGLWGLLWVLIFVKVSLNLAGSGLLYLATLGLLLAVLGLFSWYYKSR